METGSLHHPVRRLVADHDERVQADGRGRVERPVRHEPKRAGAHTATSGFACEPEPERGLVSVRAEPRHRSEDPTGGGVDDGKCRASAIAPHLLGGLDEGVGVGGPEWLGDRHPAGDLGILADGEHRGCIGGPPRPQDEVVEGQGRSGFVVHRPFLQPASPTLRSTHAVNRSGRGCGAGDGVRTRDIQLGKLTLCQLSYSAGVAAPSRDGHS